MAAILFVRVKSQLDARELDRRLIERRPRFLEVPGLVQKIYGRDEASGDVCGIYFFENQAALDAFRQSELAKTIPTAYEARDVRREVYGVLYPLRPENGPFAEWQVDAGVVT
jgi:hypothetical protein